jgi:hypothetical protein
MVIIMIIIRNKKKTKAVYHIAQYIEGSNFAQFGFGTASAQTVTISFWVKSSITGTFGVDIRNSAANRAYASTYTISVANTWEKKTVTIAGDTSGTWLQDTGIGARIEWTLSAGTDFQTATPNAWTATNDITTSSQTNWMATLANTFQLTAIQIEAGSKATPFQTATGTVQGELAACQRYYFRVVSGNLYTPLTAGGFSQSTTASLHFTPFPTEMRTAPNSLEQSGTASQYGINESGSGYTCNSVPTFNSATKVGGASTFNFASGLTVGRGAWGRSDNNTTAFLAWSAEL